jgi:hypothetical protein
MASGRIRSTRWDTAGPLSLTFFFELSLSLTREGGNDDEGIQKLWYPLSLSLTAQQGQEQYSLLLLPTWHLLSQIFFPRFLATRLIILLLLVPITVGVGE